MDGFVVVGSGTMDDVPLGLFATREEAEAFAATITEEMLYEGAGLMQRDMSTFINIATICAFVSGRLKGVDHIDLESEDE